VTITSHELIELITDEAKRLEIKEKEVEVANQTCAFNNNKRTHTPKGPPVHHVRTVAE
jgi:hypothetical protein